MSSFYASPEVLVKSPLSAYMSMADATCNLKTTALGAQECPAGQTVQFARAAGQPMAMGDVMSFGAGYSPLGGAYPVITSAPFKLYDQTNY